MVNQPPKWTFKYIERTCSELYQDELIGDLMELFNRDLEDRGIKRAKRRFIVRAILSPRLYRLPNLNEFSFFMLFNNYFKVAFRHAFQYKSITLIQLIGLSLGLAVIMYIGLYTSFELSFDNIHQNKDQLYRIVRKGIEDGRLSLPTSSKDGQLLADEFPNLKICRFGNDPVRIGTEDPKLVNDFYWSDSTFFQLFTFEFIQGNPNTCLEKVNSLVITESLSQQLFGTAQSLGKTTRVKVYDGDQEMLMEVTGIVKDPPQRSHIQFTALGSMINADQLYGSLLNTWYFEWLRSYALAPKNQDIGQIQDQTYHLILKYFGNDPAPSFDFHLQPFKDVYLQSQNIEKSETLGNLRNLVIFASIGFLVLLLSLINYINLTTALSINRSKEIGVRKLLGSKGSHLLLQFIIEAVCFTVISGTLAAIMLFWIIPTLNLWFDLQVSLDYWSWVAWLVYLFALIFIGIIAGIMPSLAMIKLPMLKDQSINSQIKRKRWPVIRQFFVGFQYFVTIFLLTSTFVVYQQYRFLKHSNLGFNTEQLLHIPVDDRQLQTVIDPIKEQMKKIPGVLGITATGEDLPSLLNNTWDFEWRGMGPNQPKSIDVVGVDKSYFDILGIPFLAGRNFTQGFEVDSANSIILNERAANLVGMDDLVGSQVQLGGRKRTIIGVVKNHHHTSLHNQMLPLAYGIFPAGTRVGPDNLLIRFNSSSTEDFLDQLKITWEGFSADPLQFNFVDEAFAKAYETEQQFARLVSSFTLIAIIISAVGIFGLISFTVKLKLKELSIRKTLGARPYQLMTLLSKDFFWVFIFALVVAIPTAYLFSKNWLNNYAYQIALSPLNFIIAGALCISISLLVILYQLNRTLKKNPAEVLAAD